MDINERLQRNKNTQEFFTPPDIVKLMINEIPEEFFINLVPFREIGCGNGNIIVQIYEKYKQYNHSHDDIIENLQLADIMVENCIDTIYRLCGDNTIIDIIIDIDKEFKTPGLISMFKINGKLITWIVQADCTKFLWWKLTEQEQILDNLFEKQI